MHLGGVCVVLLLRSEIRCYSTRRAIPQEIEFGGGDQNHRGLFALGMFTFLQALARPGLAPELGLRIER